MAQHHLPTAWLQDMASMDLRGVASISHPSKNAKLLAWRYVEGHSGDFLPFVLPYVSINL